MCKFTSVLAFFESFLVFKVTFVTYKACQPTLKNLNLEEIQIISSCRQLEI